MVKPIASPSWRRSPPRIPLRPRLGRGANLAKLTVERFVFGSSCYPSFAGMPRRHDAEPSETCRPVRVCSARRCPLREVRLESVEPLEIGRADAEVEEAILACNVSARRVAGVIPVEPE